MRHQLINKGNLGSELPKMLMFRTFDWYDREKVHEYIYRWHADRGKPYKLIWCLYPIMEVYVDQDPNPMFSFDFSHRMGDNLGSEAAARRSVSVAFEEFWLVCETCGKPKYRHNRATNAGPAIYCNYPYANNESGQSVLKTNLKEFKLGDSKELVRMRELMT